MGCRKVLVALALINYVARPVAEASINNSLLKCENNCIYHPYTLYNRDINKSLNFLNQCKSLCDSFFNRPNDVPYISFLQDIKLRSFTKKKSYDTRRKIYQMSKRAMVKRACLNDCEGIRDLCFTISSSIMGVFHCNQASRSCRQSCIWIKTFLIDLNIWEIVVRNFIS